LANTPGKPGGHAFLKRTAPSRSSDEVKMKGIVETCSVPPPPDRVGEGGGKGAHSLREAELSGNPLSTGVQTVLIF